jgi:hypothetical protein
LKTINTCGKKRVAIEQLSPSTKYVYLNVSSSGLALSASSSSFPERSHGIRTNPTRHALTKITPAQ